MRKALVLYVPVLHEGYIKLFEKYADKVDALFVLDSDLINELKFMTKEIRALEPGMAKKLVESLGFFRKISLLNKTQAEELGKQEIEIVTTREVVMKKLVKQYFPNAETTYDTAFLRWDEGSVKSDSDVKCDRESSDPFDIKMIQHAEEEADKSSDWWRRVGAVVVKNKEIILKAHNKHVPSEHSPYAEGDPRDFIKAGKDSEIASSIHAEVQIVSEAARKGVILEGASLYMNVFPCHTCAKMVVNAGIKKCFYKTGNAYLDVEKIFNAAGAEIVLVK